MEKSTVLNSIMPAEEYAEMWHKTPYIFKLEAGNKKVYYFGTRHTRDPKDPILLEIERAFLESGPDVVFVEGVNVKGDKKAFDEKIKNSPQEDLIPKMGESGSLLKLAIEKNIDWHCPEPTDEELYKHLVGNFSADYIFAWEIFHLLPQYNRLMKHEGFEQYVAPFIDRFKQSTNCSGFDYSYDRAIAIGKEVLGKNIDVENDPDALDYIDPIPWPEKKNKQTILNQISRASSLFRDKKIVGDIADALRTHNNILILYGASHAVMQEPALRKIFETIV